MFYRFLYAFKHVLLDVQCGMFAIFYYPILSHAVSFFAAIATRKVQLCTSVLCLYSNQLQDIIHALFKFSLSSMLVLCHLKQR